jgi:hypothetical protein
MLEKLGFQQLVEQTLTIKRLTRVMPVYRFVLAMVLALYVGFSRLHHLRFLEREPMLTGIPGMPLTISVTLLIFRFDTPYFVRAAHRRIHPPGDLVFDPFMGGGTTLVEAAVLGCKAVGIDINSPRGVYGPYV